MASLFTKIIRGEIPCHKISENERFFAFLDIRPINPGHTLVIPKKEIDYVFDVEDDLLAGLFTFSKKIALAIHKAVPCKRVGVMVAGLEVPHAHVHLVPINSVGDLNFAKAKPASSEELAEVAGKIRAILSK
ncbi:MAG: HIT family protein [Candidatus Omnitrophica bacterium CG11_big_fil_rev_8_21_14_0_20_45_26]|uniref:HIT family protein n=1 Tax=Candidatus Abzuiibacterium crystallinum TaxID=1974748 RepID=A0A2H0LQD6_9BACT|nr:MAG: HIT family protein [Candidatus Omnitrophica bacterium CG11_big_fil_rev_8_21_14_0_20_45_26]PIW65782.1 MAG: HIT family protein [Candidatus Omnitrophica bacterium CG12_big_fil_rev_8_21_14_0_65_45_16]